MAKKSNSVNVTQPGKKKLRIRMNRIAGQVSGIKDMIDSDRKCVDVLTQISAAKSALDAVAMTLLTDHIQDSIESVYRKNSTSAEVAALVKVLKKYVK